MRHFIRIVLFAGFLADAYADPASAHPVLAALLLLAVAVVPVVLKGAHDSVTPADGMASRQWFPGAVLGAVFLAHGAVLNSYGLCWLGVLGLSHLLLRKRPDTLGLAESFQAGAILAATGLLIVQRISLAGGVVMPDAVADALGGMGFPASTLAAGRVILAGQEIHILFLTPFWGLMPLLFAFAVGRVTLRRTWGLLGGVAVLVLARIAYVAVAASLMRQDAVLSGLCVSILELITGYALSLVLLGAHPGQRDEDACRWPGPAIGALGAAVILAVHWGWTPSDPWKGKRVLIDEAHGKWETVEAPFDMDSFGRHTVYNYRLMNEWLQNRFQTDICRSPLTNVTADIVIIKTPTKVYSEAEKSALRNYVREGGRLLVIGDHTNLFGMTDVINDLLEWSGLQLKDDAVIAVGTLHHDMPRRWWSFRPEVSRLPFIEFQTGASVVSTTAFGRPLLIANGTVAERAEYTNERFFGDLVPMLDDRPAPVCMAAVRRWGKGSVTLFSDSTVWSNFSFYAVTNERLLGALLGAGVPWNDVPAGLAVLLAVLLTGAFRRRDMRGGGRAFLGACTMDVAVAAALLFLVSDTLPPRKCQDRCAAEKRVVFDARNSTAGLRADVRTGGWQDLEDYSTFYAWLSRAGMQPEYEPGNAYGDPGRPVLLVDPKPLLGQAEVGRMLAYMRSGGRMLILLEPEAGGAIPAGNLLKRLGVKIMPARTKGAVCDALSPENDANPLSLPFSMLSSGRATPSGMRMALGRLEYGLSGVTPLLATDTGIVMAGEVDFGGGRVTVFARSKLFSEYFFGDVWGGTEPSAEKLQAYGFLKELVDHAFRK